MLKLSNKLRLLSLTIVALSTFLFGCVSKGTFQEQMIKNKTLAEQLEIEKKKNKELQSELQDKQYIIGNINSEYTNAQTNIENLKNELSKTEQTLDYEKNMMDQKENNYKKEKAKMKAEFEKNYKKLQDRMDKQNQIINELKDLVRQSAKETEMKEKEIQKSSKTYNELIGNLQKEINDGSIKISQLKNRLTVEIIDKILFASGSVEIKPKGREVLNKVSEVLKNVKEHTIRIEGHTDDLSIGGALKNRFPTNWELSASRATQVARYLVDQGIEPEELEPVGLSKFRPVADNDTPEGRQQNRRIEIILFPKNIQQLADTISGN